MAVKGIQGCAHVKKTAVAASKEVLATYSFKYYCAEGNLVLFTTHVVPADGFINIFTDICSAL